MDRRIRSDLASRRCSEHGSGSERGSRLVVGEGGVWLRERVFAGDARIGASPFALAVRAVRSVTGGGVGATP